MAANGSPIRVLIHGISGRMGGEVLAAVSAAPDMETVGGVDLRAPSGPAADVPFYSDVPSAIEACGPDVMVDFTIAAASPAALKAAAERGVHAVAGTTGIPQAELDAIDALARENGVGVVIAPNFAIGAVLLVQIAKQLGRFFEVAEVVEQHHDAKIDAPSGTALAIARALVEGRGEPFARQMPEREPAPGSRGAELDGVSIHAQRMPGRLAHHEIVLGTLGQTLSLRHDTVGRDCYMPGVLTAVRQVIQFKGLVIGLENLLDL
ncbi:MAG: 4-hydroxy-tetrahydrodipicolinate reductase [Chloroflexota bacterium]|nr:4-hydroxy-tetrahydrodipicolinate reductase [Chloroflexota bacterium]